MLHENMVLEVIFPKISFVTSLTREGSEVRFHSWRSQRLLVVEVGRSAHRYHSGHDTLETDQSQQTEYFVRNIILNK